LTGESRRWRRTLSAAFAAVLAAAAPATAEPEYAEVVPGQALEFPRDHGSHPSFRTEWWYVTGWVQDGAGRPLGFQITFFRTRRPEADRNPSSFAAHQLLIGHAAVSDTAKGRLLHEQRVAREGFDLAGARRGDTDVWIDDWSLRREGANYVARIAAREFSLDLKLEITQPPVPEGEAGFSQKGADRRSASYYYSVPQLGVSGNVTRDGRSERVTGRAWLDHEWSTSYIAQGAVGWDWIGINLEHDGALMAFRMRASDGATLWAGGSLRAADGSLTVLGPRDVVFEPRRRWRSARTGTEYPVAMAVRAGTLELTLEPLFDDQELDARTSSGTIYWEGAVRASSGGKPVGRGYLELTGYWRPMRL
jgi:predicted secreted hydrolase